MPMKRNGESSIEDGPFLIHSSTKSSASPELPEKGDETPGNTFFDEDDSGIKSGEDIDWPSLKI